MKCGKFSAQRPMLRNPVVILLCCIFFAESLFSNVELSDFANIPALWSHFGEHKKETPDITLLSFLLLHYGDSDHADQDMQNHKKLPFRTHHHHFVTFQAVQNTLIVDASQDYRFLMVIEGVAYDERPVRSTTAVIWQPPRA